MRLKDYQVAALETLSSYLKLLSGATDKMAKTKSAIAALDEDLRDSVAVPTEPTIAAWNAARNEGVTQSPDPWRALEDGVGRSIPHICFKLPTGGGKTLLAAHGLERISADHFKKTSGLVLWIVPSEAIYTQTKKQLTDRESAIRQVLDRMSGGRVKILEKLDGFTRQDTEDRLCVLMLMLPSANRENRETQTDMAAEAAFRKKVKSGEIVFKLLGMPFDNLNFEFEEIARVRVSEGDAPLLRNGFTNLERSLYDHVFQSQVNDLEKGVALYLDESDAVGWWWRIVSRQGWSLQGWKRHKIYPDFLVKLEADGDVARMLVLETKGKHLGGSEDTEFKKKLFEVLEAAYATGVEAGDVELFADAPDAMHFRLMVQEDNWKSTLQSCLA